MWKKFLPLMSVLVLAGCSSTFTRLTPSQQPRNPNNQYPVEVAFKSDQQSLRWETIQPYVVADGQTYPLRPVPSVQNRWEGYVPATATANSVNYYFKFDYKYNNMGTDPKPASAKSPMYKLNIVDQ
jgi:uncharacterized protein YceK